MDLKEIFNSFNKVNALIIGDVMIDSYMWGNVSRISPEAPVPIVAVSKKENRLGGAANVALNIQAMGATPYLCSFIGNDDGGKLFFGLMKKQKLSSDGILKSKSRTTTIKTRVLGGNHQMIRVDEEIDTPVSSAETSSLFEAVKKMVSSKKINVIIFEDYDKGCITPALISSVIEFSNTKKIPVIVDPKKRNFMEYRGVTMFKPNLKELKEGLKADFDSSNIKELSKLVDAFMKKQKIDSSLITLSEKGVYINDKKIKTLIPAHVRDITDVSGAGDTVVSVAALCLAIGLSSVNTATLANLAGGLVCEKVGVVPINKKELLKEAMMLELNQ
ncbi:MAG: ADP-heptose synthase, bifunctional sugar kinase/adenylyltransferase [Bacteroidota bacterium]|jgi:rfaE bifunctional protein kinase chain/domain|nr:ADP-heptose synthase, bifunctional sugar kinase/adenylyltransferase [Bacteroidota bacterium]